MKCHWCGRKLDNRFQAIYSTKMDKNLGFCPLCYSMAITHYYVICLGCGTTYWLRSDKTLWNFTFVYAKSCGWCLEEGFCTEKVLEQWRQVWNTQLRLSPSFLLPTGTGDQPDEEDP